MKAKTEQKQISKKKIKQVEEIVDALKNKKSFMIVSIKNLPSKQFQNIKKQLKKQGIEMRVLKKNIIKIGIESSKNQEVKKLEEFLEDNVAVIYSEKDPFEISGILSENKTSAKAKIGQEVDKEIKIESGPTEILPGPAISEFGAMGIKVAVENGKIAIKEDKVILKPGDKVSGEALGLMAKMDIMPFEIGIEPIAAYDIKNNKVYFDIKINKKDFLENLIKSFSKARAFAFSISYFTKETIGFLLGKAFGEENAIKQLIKEPEEKNEEADEAEEKSEETSENKEENKIDEEKENKAEFKENIQQNKSQGDK